jgi:hypothetical protein
MPIPSEHCRNPRWPIRLPVLHWPDDPPAPSGGVGWSRDLSEGGACLELNECLQPQRSLRLRLQTDGGAIEAEARVVWVGDPASPASGIPHGVTFTRLAPDQWRALHDVVHLKAKRGDTRFRIPIDLRATCHPIGAGGPPIEGRTGNVSWGGLLLRLPVRFAPGTALGVTLYAPGGPFKTEGVIVWAESPQQPPHGGPVRHGCQFTTLGWATALALGLVVAESL